MSADELRVARQTLSTLDVLDRARQGDGAAAVAHDLRWFDTGTLKVGPNRNLSGWSIIL